MIAEFRSLLLGGTCMLAAATVFLPFEASACSAVTAVRNGIRVVNIVCSPGDAPVAPFQASGPTDGSGIDTLTMTGGSIVATGAATPRVDGVTNLDPSAGVIDMLGGNDIVTISGGTIGTTASPIGIVLGAGADTFNMSGGTISGSVFGLGGGNIYRVSGGTIVGSLFAGSQNDLVTISGSANILGDTTIGPDSVGLEDGNDRFIMAGGTLRGAVSGGNGNDVLTISGGTIGGYVAGNAGIDRVTISGGTIAGDVEAETVFLSGGTIGGNIAGIGSTTLVINDAGSGAPINLRNGVQISGTAAVGSIVNTDLAAGGSKTQVFSGFATVSTANSTLGFGSGAIGIGTLNLMNGSTLFVRGNASMAGATNVTGGSAISMINGAAGDVFTLGGLTLNNGQLGFDVNQRTLTADRLVAGALTATGTNTVNVNLLGTPVFTRQTDIPIVVTGGPAAGTFVAQGLPGTQASLFTYQVLAGPAGLFVRATPANVGIALATQNAVDTSSIETALDALYGINRDAMDVDLGLANGTGRAQIASTLAVFASGQLAHTEHDGFTITGGGLSGDGPSFGADDFSAAISLDFDAAKHFAFDQEYGLNLGLFAGYASTDVSLDPFLGFDNVGDATNRAGMIGGYGLFRKEYSYALVSATAFLGETDIFNGVLNASGNYGTKGYAVTGSVGHIFKLSDTMRFDLRGGLLGVTFRGDDYADSNGNQYGGSEISFGAVKFEPGIYMDRQLENGMIFSPYVRADLQQRFGYTNTASLDSVEFDFDDADFSAALLTGFNLKVSKSTTVSGEIRGKMSADSQTIAGKFGLKYQF